MMHWLIEEHDIVIEDKDSVGVCHGAEMMDKIKPDWYINVAKGIDDKNPNNIGVLVKIFGDLAIARREMGSLGTTPLMENPHYYFKAPLPGIDIPMNEIARTRRIRELWVAEAKRRAAKAS
jgi:hypothetical protein